MRNTLEHLTSEQKYHLSKFLDKIKSFLSIAKIICFGTRAIDKCNWSSHPLDKAHDCPSKITVDLLIIPDPEESRTSPDIVQLIDNLALPEIQVTCIVHSLIFVNNAIDGGNIFFNTLHEHGVLLYGQDSDLHEPAKSYTLKERLDLSESVWNRTFEKARQFFKGAGFYKNDSIAGQMVFSLHQAMEQTSVALLRALTGYRADSHNPSRLLALLEHVGFPKDQLFPQNTNEEKALFAALKNSYNGVRYQDDYSISMDTANILYDRVYQFMEQAEALFIQQRDKWQAQIDKQHSLALNVAFINPLNTAS